MDVALATCRHLPEPDPDAAPLSAALEAAGLEVGWVAWDDPEANGAQADVTVLRSTWNYPRHRDAFLRWVERIARSSSLWNPFPVVRWNTHKRYMLDLEQRGIPVTPTALVPRGGPTSLAAALVERGWDDVVVKPAVSAASYRTRRFDRGSLKQGELHLSRLVRDGDALVQPYLESVDDYGERALVWIDGTLTHAVRKTPRFDGEDEHVSATAVPISTAEAELASRVVKAVDGALLYARIDVAPDADGKPVLMELELVEPSLFFPQCPAALPRFVEGVARRLSAARR